jgi:hypothetical protein
MKSAALLLVLAACDPFWGAKVTLRDPTSKAIDDATVAIACVDSPFATYASMAVQTKHGGTGVVGSIGSVFPVGCDIYIAKPGFVTQRIEYRQLCPNGPKGCDRYFELDLVMAPLTSEARLRSPR